MVSTREMRVGHRAPIHLCSTQTSSSRDVPPASMRVLVSAARKPDLGGSMFDRFKRRLTPSLVLAVVALVFATTGSAVAASKLIDGHRIKKRSIPANRLTDDARKALKGNRGRVGPRGLQAPAGERGAPGGAGGGAPVGRGGVPGARGARGERGPAGKRGRQGPKGDDGVSGYEVIDRTVAWSEGFNTETMSCPEGKVAIGGGLKADEGGPGRAEDVRLDRKSVV